MRKGPKKGPFSYYSFNNCLIPQLKLFDAYSLIFIEVEGEHIPFSGFEVREVLEKLLLASSIILLTMPDLHFDNKPLSKIIDYNIGYKQNCLWKLRPETGW